MNAIRPSASAAGVATSVMTRAVAATSLRTRGLLRIVGAAARWQADPPSVLTSTHPPKGWAPGFWLSPTVRDDSPPLRRRDGVDPTSSGARYWEHLQTNMAQYGHGTAPDLDPARRRANRCP